MNFSNFHPLRHLCLKSILLLVSDILECPLQEYILLQVDVGEEKPRTVISGLVKFIPEAEMQVSLVI